MGTIWLILGILGAAAAQKVGDFQCYPNGLSAAWPTTQIGGNCSAMLPNTTILPQPTLYYRNPASGGNDTYVLMLLKKNKSPLYTLLWLQVNVTVNPQKQLICPNDLYQYVSPKIPDQYAFLLFNKTGSRNNETIEAREVFDFNPVPWLTRNGVHNTQPIASLIFSVNSTNATGHQHTTHHPMLPPTLPPTQHPSYPPTGHQPPSHQPPSHQPPSHQPPSHQPPSHQPPSHQPPSHQPPSQQPPSHQPPSHQPPPNQQPKIPNVYKINNITYTRCYTACTLPLVIDNVTYSSPGPNIGVKVLPNTFNIDGKNFTKVKKNKKHSPAHMINGTLYTSGSESMYATMYLVFFSIIAVFLSRDISFKK